MSFEKEKSYLIKSLIRSYATRFFVHDTIRVITTSWATKCPFKSNSIFSEFFCLFLFCLFTYFCIV